MNETSSLQTNPSAETSKKTQRPGKTIVAYEALEQVIKSLEEKKGKLPKETTLKQALEYLQSDIIALREKMYTLDAIVNMLQPLVPNMPADVLKKCINRVLNGTGKDKKEDKFSPNPNPKNERYEKNDDSFGDEKAEE